MKKFEHLLSGGDFRSIGHSNQIVSQVKTQEDFDELFAGFFIPERLIVMRVADATEKITIKNPSFLQKHAQDILDLCDTARNIELKWHLALLIPRLNLTDKDAARAWLIVMGWASNPKESKIVRVNSLDAIVQMAKKNTRLEPEAQNLILSMKSENVPSLNARIKKLTR